jgi:hypothetical protein
MTRHIDHALKNKTPPHHHSSIISITLDRSDASLPHLNMAPRQKKDDRLKKWKEMLIDIGYKDKFNVNGQLYGKQIGVAWKQSGFKQQAGIRFRGSARGKKFHKMNNTITAKTLAETPLSLKEQSWLTVMRMQYCNTLEADGKWRCHLGDTVPGPFEGLEV